MSSAVPRGVEVREHRRSGASSNGNGHARVLEADTYARPSCAVLEADKPRVYVAAENRLLREALSRMLTKNREIEVITGRSTEPAQGAVLPQEAEIMLLSSKGNLDQDLSAIRKIRSDWPGIQILLIDVASDDASFLQCIRAGVRGYLPRDASAEDVVEAVHAVHQGKAVCPGALCAALFRYLEREATSFPSASVHRRLGLTRREQQLIPLIAEGLTNKEIASRFCLSEQTVKNHLYRMKQKIGADGRLGIVQVCRTQGFMV